MALLDEAFAARPLAQWAEIFDREGVWWSPVQNVKRRSRTPDAGGGGVCENQHARRRSGDRPRAGGFRPHAMEHPLLLPGIGQHTEEVLLEMGHSWEDIARLKEQGAIP